MSDFEDAIAHSLDQYTRLTQAMLLLRANAGPPWGDVNITLPQLKVLGVLLSQGHPVSGRELAGLLGVGPSAVTPLVDRLVEHGYVQRQEDRHDRRVTRLLVTDDGLELLRRMMAGRREMMADLLRQLSAEDLAVVNQSFDIMLAATARLGAPTACPTARAPSVAVREPSAN